MSGMANILQRFMGDEGGVTAIQYSLIAILCSCAIIAGLYGVRGNVNDNINDVSQNLEAAVVK